MTFSWGFMNETATRSGTPKIAFIAFVLLMLSEGISDVSMVPGGWLSSTW